VGGDKLSVTWCQPIGLMKVVERRGECGSQCSFEERRYGREKF